MSTWLTMAEDYDLEAQDDVVRMTSLWVAVYRAPSGLVLGHLCMADEKLVQLRERVLATGHAHMYTLGSYHHVASYNETKYNWVNPD